MKEVLYIPELRNNLLSVLKLTKAEAVVVRKFKVWRLADHIFLVVQEKVESGHRFHQD